MKKNVRLIAVLMIIAVIVAVSGCGLSKVKEIIESKINETEAIDPETSNESELETENEMLNMIEEDVESETEENNVNQFNVMTKLASCEFWIAFDELNNVVCTFDENEQINLFIPWQNNMNKNGVMYGSGGLSFSGTYVLTEASDEYLKFSSDGVMRSETPDGDETTNLRFTIYNVKDESFYMDLSFDHNEDSTFIFYEGFLNDNGWYEIKHIDDEVQQRLNEYGVDVYY